MSTKRIVSAAFSFLLLLTLSCDSGGSKDPVEPEFRGTVEGIVIAEATGLPGATIRLGGAVTRTAQTSASGQFSFSGLPEGTYLVELITIPEDVEFTTTSKNATLGSSRAVVRVDFNGGLKRDASISGTVTMEGVGMPGLSLSLSGPETRSGTTDAQGHFAFEDLKRGEYSLTLDGFDPALHAFPSTVATVAATSSSPTEAHFAGTLIPQAPDAPLELSALAMGPGTVALSWTDASTDESRFEIDRKASVEEDWSLIVALDTDSTTYDDEGLMPNTTYWYRVRACNDVGCSAYSNQVEATTDDVPPASPEELTASTTGPFTVNLSWVDGSGNETRFEVERKEGTEGSWSSIGTPGSDTTTFDDAGLQPNTLYHYRVRACNDMGCSAWTSETSAITDEVPPTSPSELTASPTGSTTASLGWTDTSDNEDGFEVERREGSGDAWSQVGTPDSDVTEFADSGLTPNTTYAYRVRACNEAGCSDYSGVAEVVTNEVPPDAPTALEAVATSSSTIDLSWTDASTNEAVFEIERKRGRWGSWSQVAEAGADRSELQDTGLHSNTSYSYRIRACNDVGCSSYSNEASAKTLEAPPEAPSHLSASATGSTTIDVSWNDESNNESQFRIERKEGAGGSWNQVGSEGPGTETFGDGGLSPSTTYYYRVRACNSAGCSTFAGEAHATTLEPPPEAPTGLSAGATGPATVDLSWTDESTNESQFRVERKEGSGGSWNLAGTVGANNTSYGDSGLSPNTTYHYRVMACNGGGCSAPSSESDATTWNVPPQTPTSLSANATGPSSIQVSWTDESTNEEGFRVERKEGAAGVYAEAGTVGANTTTFSDSGLSPDTEYFYQVYAYNGEGDSGASNEDSATTWTGVGPNLSIANLYLTQSTQTLSGDVPLVADRDGYLRVFAVASEANSLQPSVRVRFYLGGSLAHTETISAPGGSVPTSVDESSLGASWNVSVPAALLQPNLSILADVDPTNQVAEGNEGDNSFPLSGSPLVMDVRTTPTFEVTFIPVRQSVNGLVGNVNAGNVAQFMDATLERLPMAQANVDLHAEYTTDVPALESGGDNWSPVLSEILALRNAEGSSRYYYGVVKVSYGGGVAGMGYIGWPAAIGWDKLPSGSGVAAHEWGHNFGLRHASGCGATGVDPAYPYADGKIGVWGLDVTTTSLKSPSTYYDFMSYCNPDWISDYHYEKIMDFRQMSGGIPAPGEPEPGLLVWGRTEGDRIVLEPVFEVTAPPALPSGDGDYLLEGLDSSGRPLFGLSFQPTLIPDAPNEESHFAFVLPLRSFDQSRLHRLQVRGGGHAPASLQSRIPPERVATPEPELTPRGEGVVEMTWDGESFPMALIRDPATGEVLSFARGGRIRLPVASDEVEVLFSDGLRSPERIRRSVR